MYKYNTLIDYFEIFREIENRGILFEKVEGSKYISYKMLSDEVLKISEYLKTCGVEKGTEIIIYLDSTERQIISFWACLLNGMIPVIFPINKKDIAANLKLVSYLFNNFKKPCIFMDENMIDLMSEYFEYTFIQNNILNYDEINCFCKVVDYVRPDVRPDDIAMLQYSSGSTGMPKGIILTHRNVVTNLIDMDTRLQFTDEEKQLSWLPLNHNLGLIGFHILPACKFINHCIMDTVCFIKDPIVWMKVASKYKATVIVSPNFGFKHFVNICEMEKVVELDLSCVRYIICGGEPVSFEITERFINLLSTSGMSNDVLYPAYGMAESTLCISLPGLENECEFISISRNNLSIGQKVSTEFTDHEEVLTLALLGRPLDTTLVRICDYDGKILEDGYLGVIQVKGGSITQGYYKNEEQNQSSFTGDKWFITKDIGFIHEGKLVISGRMTDMIIINGVNYFPQDIEAIFEEIDKFSKKDIVVCGVDNKEEYTQSLVVFCKNIDESLFEEITVLINLKTGLIVSDVIKIEEIPITSSGKVQRSVLKDMYERGMFTSLYREECAATSENVDEIKNKIRKACELIFDVENIDDERSFFEYCVSSTEVVQLCEFINTNISTDVKIVDIFNTGNVLALSDLIVKKYNDTNVKINFICVDLQDCFVEGNKQHKNMQSMSFELNKGKVAIFANNLGLKINKSSTLFEKLFLIECCKLSNKQYSSIQSNLNRKDFAQITVDLSEYSTPEEFICKGNLTIERYKEEKLEESVKYLVRDKEIIPLIYDGLIKLKDELLDYFDLRLRINEKENCYIIALEYDENRYKRELMELILNDFANIVLGAKC